MKELLLRGLKAFGHFWLDFLVGDTPELFFAVLVLVGLAFALRSHRAVAIVLLPALAIVSMLASAWRGRRRAPLKGAAIGDGAATATVDPEQ